MTKNIALVGSGSSVIGYLSGLGEKISKRDPAAGAIKIVIFEQSQIAGSGLPYDKTTTSPEHLFNIQTVSSSIPSLSIDSDKVRSDKRGFFEWLSRPETESYLQKEFEEIFSERFCRVCNRRFGGDFAKVNIFDQKFEETDFFRANQEREGFSEMLEYRKKRFESYIKKIKEDAKNEYGFLPRIIYGFYSKALFDYQVSKLKNLGVDVDVRCETKVVKVEKKSDHETAIISSNKLGEEGKEFFDYAFIASGLWEAEKSPYKNPNHIHNIWPASRVEEIIENAAIKAKEEGRDSIKVGILGTSLSAVDMMRTCFKDGTEIDGVKIYVDMCSRNGRFQKIKGNFRYLEGDFEKHMPEAMKKVMEGRGLKFEKVSVSQPDNRSNVRKFYDDLNHNMKKLISQKLEENNPKQVIYLYQVLDLFLEIFQAANENAGLVKEASEVGTIREVVLKNGENYKETISYLRSLEKENPFAQLTDDLESLQKREDHIFQHIFNLFDDSAAYRSFLPPEEKAFRTQFGREFLGKFWATMPEESARELLEKYKNGHLNVRKLGRTPEKLIVPDEGLMGIPDSQGDVVEYDVVIDSTRSKIKTRNSDLYQSIADEFGKALKPEEVVLREISDKESFAKSLSSKFGEDYAGEMLQAGQFEFDDVAKSYSLIFRSDDYVSSANLTQASPSLTVSRTTSSIFSAIGVGAGASGKISLE